MARQEWSWTPHQLDKLNKVQNIISELQDYVPLTLRQIYYQMVSKGYIGNKKSQYDMLSGLLKWARIDGYVDWDNIEDRVRAFHYLQGFSGKKHYINHELHYFLNDYTRDLLQTQDKYIEIWVEKDALSSIFTRVAKQYTASVVTCRGYSSVSFLHDFQERATNDGRESYSIGK